MRLRWRAATGLDDVLQPVFFGASRPDFDGLPEPVRSQIVEQQSTLQLSHYTATFDDCLIEIIEHGGEPVARLITGTAPGDAALTLVDIVVLPVRRGHGLGAQIVSELQQRAEAGGRGVRCSVHRGNPGSLRFHERLGFTVVSQAQDRWHLEWYPPDPAEA